MVTSISQEMLHQMVARWTSPRHESYRFKIYKDTSDFFRVEYGGIVVLNEKPFLILHNAKEGRFGLDDDEKFWVKRSIDLTDGCRKIIKLVFHEKFTANIAGISFECFRSPRKEARILKLVAGHKNFMHGYAVEDEKGNIVRVLDIINGKNIHTYVQSLNLDHKTYFYERFPEILSKYIECIRAVKFLHENNEKHGDIRRDHIFIDRDSGDFRWIDFDYNYRHRENIYGYDLFGLGNILIFLTGMGDLMMTDLKNQNHPALSSLTDDDVNIVFHNRVANLKKVYPYIPETLNTALMHFSKGANWFYDNTGQLLEDLEGFIQTFKEKKHE
ncbi:MAG: serine/threonine protein kinase [Desulfobacterales bacterium]|nr:serine/threonine protein kinase [Desulfobacterales bacterium]